MENVQRFETEGMTFICILSRHTHGLPCGWDVAGLHVVCMSLSYPFKSPHPQLHLRRQRPFHSTIEDSSLASGASS